MEIVDSTARGRHPRAKNAHNASDLSSSAASDEILSYTTCCEWANRSRSAMALSKRGTRCDDTVATSRIAELPLALEVTQHVSSYTTFGSVNK